MNSAEAQLATLTALLQFRVVSQFEFFWHEFDLPKCQVHWGGAAVCLNVHFDGLFVYFLHFAPKTSERTIDDLYDAAFKSLMMFAHTTIRFSYGPRGPGFETLPHQFLIHSTLKIFAAMKASSAPINIAAPIGFGSGATW
jgi:hypothetical protein